MTIKNIVLFIINFRKKKTARVQYSSRFVFVIKLQVQNSVLNFLRSALIPELSADIAAGTACNIHLVLILITAVRASPNKFSVLVLNDFYLAVIAAALTVIALCIKFCVHNIIIDKAHYLKHGRNIILHIGNLDIRDCAAR